MNAEDFLTLQLVHYTYGEGGEGAERSSAKKLFLTKLLFSCYFIHEGQADVIKY